MQMNTGIYRCSVRELSSRSTTSPHLYECKISRGKQLRVVISMVNHRNRPFWFYLMHQSQVFGFVYFGYVSFRRPCQKLLKSCQGSVLCLGRFLGQRLPLRVRCVRTWGSIYRIRIDFPASFLVFFLSPRETEACL